jgi:HK97 family phage major capsid protein
MSDPVKALTDLRNTLSEKVAEMKNLVVERDRQVKELGETRSEHSALLRKQDEQITQVLADIQGVKGALEPLAARIDEMERKAGRPTDETTPRSKSIGEAFVTSPEYKSFLEDDKARGKSKPFNMGSFWTPRKGSGIDLSRKSLTSSNLRETLSVEIINEIMTQPIRTNRVRDMFRVIPTQNSVIEFIRETGFTNNAGMVADEQNKPETDLTLTDASVNVRTIAHWIPIANQMLSDVPALQSYLDTRLMDGIALKEDQQILYGTGISPELDGIANDADVQTYLWSAGAVGDTKLDAVRRAMTLADLAYYPVEFCMVHPSDWEDMELQKDTDGQYIWTTVPAGGVPTIWRVPVVVSTAINAGDFLLGNSTMACAIYDKEEASIRVTDSHSDFFIRNKTVILAEERLALAVFRPESLVYGRFDSAPAPLS